MQRQAERDRLIEALRNNGIGDERVLEVMRSIPRELFVPADNQASAYADRALPIEEGQTISQPYMVALMTEQLALRGPEHVLEIGTGSGYQAAILARLCRRVITIERIPELSRTAQRVLRRLQLDNVECLVGDGSTGWPAGAPYDGILVTAGAPEIPWPLYEQLAIGGCLVVPVGNGGMQLLKTITRTSTGPEIRDVCSCTFVPLIGTAGWRDAEERTRSQSGAHRNP